MARSILLLAMTLVAACAILAIRACGAASPPSEAVADPDSIVSLHDDTVFVAPAGSAIRELIDWFNDPHATPMRFEVGGEQFAPNAMTPTPMSSARVGRLARMLRAYPDVHITVIGASNPGSDPAKDLSLSKQRAAVVAKLIESQGVDPARLSVVGEGGSHPLVSPSAAESGRNDRVALGLAKTS